MDNIFIYGITLLLNAIFSSSMAPYKVDNVMVLFIHDNYDVVQCYLR